MPHAFMILRCFITVASIVLRILRSVGIMMTMMMMIAATFAHDDLGSRGWDSMTTTIAIGAFMSAIMA